MKEEYKALWVKPETHKKCKILAAEREVTIDEFINGLADSLLQTKLPTKQ